MSQHGERANSAECGMSVRGELSRIAAGGSRTIASAPVRLARCAG